MDKSHPLTQLPPEDQDMVVQFVLASGSLKDLAVTYGVSYPTIRQRLDQLVERLRAVLNGKRKDPVAELLADLVEQGQLTLPAAKAIRETVRRQKEGHS